MKNSSGTALVESYFKAYETKDIGILKEILSQDFTFTSPADKRIGLEEYFERCWPGSKDIQAYSIQNLLTDGNEVFVRCECRLYSGDTFNNMEHFKFADSQIQEIIVYFGFEEDVFSKARAKRFDDAFASGNIDFVMENISDETTWHLVGSEEITGKENIAEMFAPMREPNQMSNKTTHILVSGDKAVIEGEIEMPSEDGEIQIYAYCDVYTFAHPKKDMIKNLKAYMIALPKKMKKN
ncbi:nuclear transport factor 2 family protein [Alkalicoccus daliensis]|uniref:Ketosteroid isomerase-related protein n=1 Tax=Alkalicoccus daliensis TaxID=745820 RepID=A0A1H0E585_9BACI|nr:nuclear transport factor 2 family protein [Alkalicoccus daliensis]SDN77617.1 Ketosteroid isomerase-related protein [Alkalicoccus daliensis]